MEEIVNQIWKKAVESYKNAQGLVKPGDAESIKIQAQNSAYSSLFSLKFVLEGRNHSKDKSQDAAELILNEFLECQEFFDTSHSASQYLEKARKVLKLCSNMSPPENRLPFE